MYKNIFTDYGETHNDGLNCYMGEGSHIFTTYSLLPAKRYKYYSQIAIIS